MNEKRFLVREFMKKHDQEIPESPCFPDEPTQELRIALLLEEVLELDAAYLRGAPLVDTLDALVDIQYVLEGAILAYGLDGVFDEAFRRVHENNMLKPLKKDSNMKVQKDPDHPKVHLEDLV